MDAHANAGTLTCHAYYIWATELFANWLAHLVTLIVNAGECPKWVLSKTHVGRYVGISTAYSHSPISRYS